MKALRQPRNLKIVVISAVIVAAFVVASVSIYRASRTGAESRKALCQVLLFVRAASLQPADGQPPTPAQAREIDDFYTHLVSLVQGCHLPTKGTP